jgi:hypothetical protein
MAYKDTIDVGDGGSAVFIIRLYLHVTSQPDCGKGSGQIPVKGATADRIHESMISFAEAAGYSWVKITIVAEKLVDPGFAIALAAGTMCLALLGYWLATGVGGRRSEKGGIMLKEGSKAPDFTVLDDHGNKVSLSDYHGKKSVVLFFYPKANTPG